MAVASLPQAMHVFPVARDASRIRRVRLGTVPMIVGGRTYRHRVLRLPHELLGSGLGSLRDLNGPSTLRQVPT